MDFYVDLAVAVLLRLLKDRRNIVKYYDAVAKVYGAISRASESDVRLRDAIQKQADKRA